MIVYSAPAGFFSFQSLISAKPYRHNDNVFRSTEQHKAHTSPPPHPEPQSRNFPQLDSNVSD